MKVQKNDFKHPSNLNCEISAKSLQLLDEPSDPETPESWLNDEIINGYIELVEKEYQQIQEKDRKKFPEIPLKKVVFFNTYAYPKLCQLYETNDISKFDRILKRKNISNLLNYDSIFIPVNIEKHHWLLVKIDT